MPDKSKIRRDDSTGYPKYDRYTDYEDGKHTHEWGAYTKDGKYYEGGHGENISKESKEESGRIFRKLILTMMREGIPRVSAM